MRRPVRSPSKPSRSLTRGWNSSNCGSPMPVLLTPGVSRRPRREPQPGLQFVRTDVAGFAGISERGPLPDDVKHPQDAVVRLTSWAEFTAKFGGFVPKGYLAYAVRAFFENGGRVCHAIR